jgi:hypothetical protein
MKEPDDMQAHLEALERHSTEQHSEIYRLKLKIRAALAALQTGSALDVVVAIGILRS